jgi:hypothetical protein
MGLFSSKPKAPPTPAPEITRKDVAVALASTSERERLALTVGGAVGSDIGSIGALPEIALLSDALPETEEVLSVAQCRTLSSAAQTGVIALTASRVVAVVGLRQRGAAVGQPTVYMFPLTDLTSVSFAPRHYGGGIGYFDLAGRSQVILDVAAGTKKDTWWETFAERVMQEYNRSKF